MGLTFDQAAHAYHYDGVRLPSVTQIIESAGLGVDYSMVPRDVLERKRIIGEKVHLACRFADEADLDVTSLDPVIAPRVQAYLKFLAETAFEPLGTELALGDVERGYAGTPDCWGILNSAQAVLDRKTLAVLDVPSAALQAAGYLPLIDDFESSPWHRAKRYALQLRPNGTYRLVDVALPAADATFAAALAECRGAGTPDTAAILRQWKDRHGTRH